jgi:hypothetical protein
MIKEIAHVYLIYEDFGYGEKGFISIASSKPEAYKLLEEFGKLESNEIVIVKYKLNSSEEPETVYNSTFNLRYGRRYASAEDLLH